MDQWCTGSQATHSALIIRGILRTSEAWRYRGGGYANTVSRENHDKFKQVLKAAQKDFEIAYSKNPSDPNSASRMIAVCMGLSCSRSVMENWFARAVAANPLCDRAHQRKVEISSSKVARQ